jgi:NADH:ubiquinone oxidoreductase subunit 6 (subunit J)
LHEEYHACSYMAVVCALWHCRIYFILDYTFLGAAQISIYAGGITIMYIFAIQLVSKRTLQNLVARFKGVRIAAGR